MYTKQFRYLLRVTLQIRDRGIGLIDYPIELERVQRGLTAYEYPNEGNHIAIFECQLKMPPVLSLSDTSHQEFLFASRLNFSKWKLVDLDNYMKGNKPFTEINFDDSQEKYQAKIDSTIEQKVVPFEVKPY